jgi:hypothetical protein
VTAKWLFHESLAPCVRAAYSSSCSARIAACEKTEEPGVRLTPDNKRCSAGRRANPHFLQADPYFEAANDPKAQDKQRLPFQRCKLDFFVSIVVSQVAITNQTREPADCPPLYFVRCGTSAGNSNRRGTNSVYLLLYDYATTHQVERAEIASDEFVSDAGLRAEEFGQNEQF